MRAWASTARVVSSSSLIDVDLNGQEVALAPAVGQLDQVEGGVGVGVGPVGDDVTGGVGEQDADGVVGVGRGIDGGIGAALCVMREQYMGGGGVVERHGLLHV